MPMLRGNSGSDGSHLFPAPRAQARRGRPRSAPELLPDQNAVGPHGRDGVVLFFQAEDGIRDPLVTGVQTCALPISSRGARPVTGTTMPGLVPQVTCGT